MSAKPRGIRSWQPIIICETGNFVPGNIVVDACTIRRNLAARWPHAKIILLDTGVEDEEIINLLISHRLDGVIRTDTNLPLFKKALRVIGEEEVWIDHSRIRALLSYAESLNDMQKDTSLSKREREIILIFQGCKNSVIADTLHIGEQTVKSHISNIFIKTL